MDCWRRLLVCNRTQNTNKRKLRIGGGRQAHSCKGIRKIFVTPPNSEGPQLPFISENIFLFWMTSQIKAPTPLYFWKYFPFWMKRPN
jgi:hypothetical protein